MSSSSSSSSSTKIQANLTSCVSCIAFKTWSRMNSKSRNSEIKYLQTRPSRIAVSKFADVNPQIQENIAEFMKTRNQKKRFSSTLGKKSKQLNEEEKQARENLVNHLSTLADESNGNCISETVEMDVPRRLLKKSKGDGKEKGKGEKKKDEFIDDDEKDTIDGFDETEFEFEPAQASSTVPATATAKNVKSVEENKTKTSLFEFDKEEEEEEEEDDEDHLSDEESVHSKFNVALEARKRKVGKISPKEFQNIFEILVDDILQENFHINPAEPFEETMLRTILSSDLFWSTLFKRMDEVTEKEKESKIDDKLVLYIRNQKK